jgi:choline monooxygenase
VDTTPAPVPLDFRDYVDPAAFDEEVDRCWSGAWHYVGTVSGLDRPGDQRAGTALDVPILLVRDAAADDRDQPGELRAFVNACRHRGARLVDEATCARSIRCRYHGWTYDLDGALRAAPLLEQETGAPLGSVAAQLGLRQLRLERWGPMLFVALDQDAMPLHQWLGPIPARVAALGVEVDALQLRRRSEGEVACNWKVACENYLECYHCRIAHRDFCAVVDVAPDAYQLLVDGRVATQVAPRHGDAGERAAGGGYDGSGTVERGEFHFVFPNLVAYVAPGRPVLAIGPVVPRAIDRTWRSLDYLAAPGVDEAWLTQLLAWDDQVGEEDQVLVEAVQAGMAASRVVERGVLLPRSEQLVGWFADHVRRARS